MLAGRGDGDPGAPGQFTGAAITAERLKDRGPGVSDQAREMRAHGVGRQERPRRRRPCRMAREDRIDERRRQGRVGQRDRPSAAEVRRDQQQPAPVEMKVLVHRIVGHQHGRTPADARTEGTEQGVRTAGPLGAGAPGAVPLGPRADVLPRRAQRDALVVAQGFTEPPERRCRALGDGAGPSVRRRTARRQPAHLVAQFVPWCGQQGVQARFEALGARRGSEEVREVAAGGNQRQQQAQRRLRVPDDVLPPAGQVRLRALLPHPVQAQHGFPETIRPVGDPRAGDVSSGEVHAQHGAVPRCAKRVGHRSPVTRAVSP